jgi:hypothetical protein
MASCLEKICTDATLRGGATLGLAVKELVMSNALFRERLGKSRLHADDILWMPRWLEEFARTHPESDGLIPFSDADVLKFLQQLRDRKVPSWQRLQAARTLEWYQTLVLRNSLVDFSYYQLKLQELA